MPFTLDIINILILIVVVFNSTLGLFVYLTKREEKINKNFFVFSTTATLWGLSMFFFRSTAGTNLSVVFVRVLYFSAALIPFVFLFFIRVFPQEKHGLPEKYLRLLSVPFFYVTFITFIPNYLILGTSNTGLGEQTIIFNTFYHSWYALYIITYFSVCYVSLFVKYFKFKGIEKIQITYVIVGTFIATIIGVSTNLIMPYLGDFRLNWLGQIGIIAMVGSISYSILRHRLFNVKVIATQFTVFILCTSLFARTLFSSTRSDLLINISFLLITSIIGTVLIKNVVKEVQLREKIECLAKDLEIANSSLAAANDRLKELDQLKSEFLSLATHQIRAPLTAVKGYASLILEGDFGEISTEVRQAVKTIFQSCHNLVVIVGEFLDISRIEQGKMKYDVTDFDIGKLARDIVNELRPNIESAGLTVEIKEKEGAICTAHADIGKTKQVLGNLIDNAIKYTPKGSIVISLSSEAEKSRIAITDSGIGIASEDIPKLFGKFIRAKDANKTNVIGTGLGLYVAKQMIEAQGGKIWVESKGKGTGSTFIIELSNK